MLPQPLQIFRKDLQHLWPETLVVLLLFAGFAAAAPSGWGGSEYAGYMVFLAGVLKIFLMPVSWLVVIARLVQDEPLVGDRQFWTSRPYRWPQLLLSKVLYLLVFLYLPFFVMQVYLLHHAGLHPLLAMPALAHNLLLLTVLLVLPVMAIAAVTSSFGRLLLTVVVVLIGLLVLSLLFIYLDGIRMLPPHLDWLAAALLTVLPLGALLLQYRTRRTQLARLLLVLTPVVTLLVLLVLPSGPWIAHSFPVTTGAAVPKLAATPDPGLKPTPSGGDDDLLQWRNRYVVLQLPLAVTGGDDRDSFQVTGAQARLTGSGVDYTSPFNTVPGPQVGGGSPFASAIFYLPLEVFRRIHDQPVDLHLRLAAQHLAIGKEETWHTTDRQPFDVPGHGVCSFPGPQDFAREPSCRYPFASPEISSVQAAVSANGCPSPAEVPGRAQLGGQSGALQFDPVVTAPLSFRTLDPNPTHRYALCPGTDLHFAEGGLQSGTSLEVDAKSVVLDGYVSRKPRAGSPMPESTQ